MLKERNFGILESHTWPEIQAQWPDMAAAWQQPLPDWAPAGGESLRAVHQRVMQCMTRIHANHAGQTVLLVTHGGVLDAIYRAACGLPIQAMRDWPQHNAAVNRIGLTPQGLHIVRWGDAAHLD
jgi:probable phosphoglycerate mutase